jgi:hypothetical protein
MAKHGSAQAPSTPPVQTGHTVEGLVHTLTFADGIAFEVRDPHYDRMGRLWAEIMAKLDGAAVNQATINLLDQRQRVDFHQIAGGRDGRVDWQDYLLSLITPLQERLAGEASCAEAALEGKAERWPTLDKKALHGLAGTFVIAIDPYTEADLVAILLNILTAFGNAVGSRPHFRVEEEFAQALKVMSREGNILSPVLRQAWDTGDLHPLTKTNPIRATDAHISIVGHITRDELLRHLGDTERANGFANRFLWACVKRSKEIPDPTCIPEHVLNPLIIRLHNAVEAAQQIGEVRRDEETRELWSDLYPALSADKPGLLGAITARAEAQVMRLACIYAALDSTAIIQRPHLEAALAVWQCCEASARYIFGDSTGDSIADRILAALQEKGPMDRTAISGLFGRNMPSARIERALAMLEQSKRIIVEPIKNAQGRRPLTVIRLVEQR